MLRGDLVQVRQGLYRLEGQIGLLMSEANKPFGHCIVLFPAGVEEINRFWLEEIGSRASSVAGDTISASKEA